MFAAGFLGGLPVVLAMPFLFVVWIAGVLAYFALNIFFSIRVARRTDKALIWRLPLVFFVIHLWWGSGFWAGVLQFKILRRVS
jgi:hypothetical protein